MIWSDKWRDKDYSIIERIGQYLSEMIEHELFLQIFSTCQEKHIPLHAVNIKSGNNFYIRVCLFYLLQIVLAVVWTGC
jgi:hypothetical protein